MLKKLSTNNTLVTHKMEERTANIPCTYPMCKPYCGHPEMIHMVLYDIMFES